MSPAALGVSQVKGVNVSRDPSLSVDNYQILQSSPVLQEQEKMIGRDRQIEAKRWQSEEIGVAPPPVKRWEGTDLAPLPVKRWEGSDVAPLPVGRWEEDSFQILRQGQHRRETIGHFIDKEVELKPLPAKRWSSCLNSGGSQTDMPSVTEEKQRSDN